MSPAISAFRTSDLDAAAYLSLKNVKLLDVERSGPGSLATLIFEPRGALVVAEFYGGASVVAMDYAAQLRAMKRAIFGARERGSR